jgi:N-acylneuraminate cytidylyltransferase/CMP-N,N'-diacetyllegionaminic acid synthase
MTYTAIVPARSGSKRLPHKNIKLLVGKPLLVWTLEACANADHSDEVIVSTDSMDYWDIARQHVPSKKLTLDFRAPDEAGDTIKIFDYLKDKREKIFAGRNGAFVLALPTVPLRRAHHFNEAIELFETTQRPVFSATNYGFPISFAFHLDEMRDWSPVFSDSPMVTGNTRSQNQQEAYHPNGAIYVRSIADLADQNLTTLYVGAAPYMMSRTDSIDIDAEIDFKMAEALLG